MITFEIQPQFVTDGYKIYETEKDIYRFENTLLAMKKWEALYQKPWLGRDPKTANEVNYYFKCMNVDEDKDIKPELLSPEQRDSLLAYMDNKMGAHRLPKRQGGSKGQSIIYTAEVIYAYCIINRIDLFWAEKQNLNQLLTIIGVIDALQSPPKKKSQAEILRENEELNEQRLKQYKTRG